MLCHAFVQKSANIPTNMKVTTQDWCQWVREQQLETEDPLVVKYVQNIESRNPKHITKEVMKTFLTHSFKNKELKWISQSKANKIF